MLLKEVTLKKMGIFSFFTWLRNTHPSCFVGGEFSKVSPKIDWLFIDANAILHQCAQRVYNYGQHRRFLLPSMPRTVQNDTKVGDLFIDELERLYFEIDPQKGMYVHVDGVAPFAKITKQRQRRYTSVLSGNTFDSCLISPGTTFMTHICGMVSKHFCEAVNQVPVFVSTADDVQEGEHKCLSIIRSSEAMGNEESCCIFSPDADLVMLGLALCKPNIYIARENNGMRVCKLHYVSIASFCTSLQSLQIPPVDFIFMMCLVGNDFLPHIPTLNIIEGGIEKMFDAYKTAFTQHEKPILCKQDKRLVLNKNVLRCFLTLLAQNEENFINDKLNSTSRQFYPCELFNEFAIQKNSLAKIQFEPYKTAYYKQTMARKLQGSTPQQSHLARNIKNMCKQYWTMLMWVMHYYIFGVTNWRMTYKYHYAPFLGDLVNHIKIKKKLIAKQTEPFPTKLQLMCICPPESFAALELDNTLIKRAPYYFPSASKIKIDLAGKYNSFEGVPLVPFIDAQKIHSLYKIMVNK